MKSWSMPKFCLAGVVSLWAMSSASAAVIGNLDTGSSGSVTVTLSDITFNNDPSAIGGGNSNVASSTNLTFAGCVLGTPGSLGCLGVAEGVTVLSPLNAGSVGATNFLTFANHANLVFSLDAILPGSANTVCSGLSVGQSCSAFAGSPIVLTLLANNQTLVGISLAGRASDTGVGGLATGSNYNGGFSQILASLLPNGNAPTPENIQLYFCPSGTCTAADFLSGRAITTSQSGSFSASAIPEPATYALAGIALLGFGALRRFRS